MDHLCYICLVFVMLLRMFIATLWSPDLLALVCDVNCVYVTFPCGILSQVWCLIVSIPYFCHLSYFKTTSSPEPLVQIQNCITEMVLMMPSTKIARSVLLL